MFDRQGGMMSNIFWSFDMQHFFPLLFLFKCDSAFLVLPVADKLQGNQHRACGKSHDKRVTCKCDRVKHFFHMCP